MFIGGFMRHEVRILKLSDGWWLQIMSYEGINWEYKVFTNTAIYHETLEEALNTARTLSLHVENIEELPLTQYKMAG
jgi:hypothetical protein